MSGAVEVTWGAGSHRIVRTVTELDALLNDLDLDARGSGLPQNVDITSTSTFTIVVGHERSVLNHIPADSNPPYLTSVGEEDGECPFTYFVRGDHHSEAWWRNTIPADLARQAARTFLLTNCLDDRVSWTEV